jgi:NitT/TauT family transport system substrate-binding protein
MEAITLLDVIGLGAIGLGVIGVGVTAARCDDSGAVKAQPPTIVRFMLDRPIDGALAPFVVASTKGFWSDAGVKAVFVVFNAAPYAIMARKSRGIRSLADLKGKTLGVAEGDLSIRLWRAIAERNGLDPASVKQQHISAAVREPMLSAGQVDAVTGFSYLSAVNLRDRGIPADDLAVLRFADYGCDAYGAALIVNPAFVARRPEAARAFLESVIAGMRFAIKTPAAAIDAVMTRMNGGSRDLDWRGCRARS